MAAQRCSVCGLNYPLSFQRCQVCDTVLDRMQNAAIDDDWQIQVERRSPIAVVPPVTQKEKVGLWRLEQALRLGYPVETAESLAADMSVDLNRLRLLVEREHVPLALAARIA